MFAQTLMHTSHSLDKSHHSNKWVGQQKELKKVAALLIFYYSKLISTKQEQTSFGIDSSR
jgi:hypothetical protein